MTAIARGACSARTGLVYLLLALLWCISLEARAQTGTPTCEVSNATLSVQLYTDGGSGTCAVVAPNSEPADGQLVQVPDANGECDVSAEGTTRTIVQWNATSNAWDCPFSSGGIANVVDDTTPQLGGPLDLNGQNVNTGVTTLDPTEFDPLDNGIEASDLPQATTTAIGAVELATDGENAANLVPQADDSRLSDSRTPTTHASTHAATGADSTTFTHATDCQANQALLPGETCYEADSEIVYGCPDGASGGSCDAGEGEHIHQAKNPRAEFVDDVNCSVVYFYEEGVGGWDPSPNDNCGDRTVIRDGHTVQVPNALDDETVRGTPTPTFGSTPRRGVYEAVLGRYLPGDEYEDCLEDPNCNAFAKAFLATIHPPDRAKLFREVTFWADDDLIDGTCNSSMCGGWSFYQTNTTVSRLSGSASTWPAARYAVGTTTNDRFSFCADDVIRVTDPIASDGDSGAHGGSFEAVFKIANAASSDFFVGLSTNGCGSDFWSTTTMGTDAIGFWMQNREMWATARDGGDVDYSVDCANCINKQIHCTGGTCETFPADRTIALRVEVDHHYGARLYMDGEMVMVWPPGTSGLDLASSTSATYTAWFAYRRTNTAGVNVDVNGLKVGIYAPQY